MPENAIDRLVREANAGTNLEHMHYVPLRLIYRGMVGGTAPFEREQRWEWEVRACDSFFVGVGRTPKEAAEATVRYIDQFRNNPPQRA